MTAAPEDIKRARDLLTFGLILLTLGTIRIVEGGIDFVRVWPLFILAAALAHLRHPELMKSGRQSRAGAVWLLFVAGWGIVTMNHLFGFDYTTSWPLLLIGGGVIIVWRSLLSPSGCSNRGTHS
jgi:hypothetical protein